MPHLQIPASNYGAAENSLSMSRDWKQGFEVQKYTYNNKMVITIYWLQYGLFLQSQLQHYI